MEPIEIMYEVEPRPRDRGRYIVQGFRYTSVGWFDMASAWWLWAAKGAALLLHLIEPDYSIRVVRYRGDR